MHKQPLEWLIHLKLNHELVHACNFLDLDNDSDNENEDAHDAGDDNDYNETDAASTDVAAFNTQAEWSPASQGHPPILPRLRT